MKRFFSVFWAFFLLICVLLGCSIGEAGLSDYEQENDESPIALEPELEEDDDDESEPLVPELLMSEFISGKFISEMEIIFEFSTPVRVLSMSFEPYLEIGSVDEGSIVTVYLEENPQMAIKLAANLEVEDEWENVINVQLDMVSRNSRVPEMQINELRTEYSKPRVEYIELKMLSDGNLGALRVFAASNYKAPMIYEFSPVEVTEGEYVVLHLRSLEELCIDEYGDDLDESGAADSCPTARDFWIPDSVKLLRKTDAVYIMDQDDNVLDAVMISETPDSVWDKDYLAEAAEFLFSKEAWKSPSGGVCSPADAVSSAEIKTSATRSISRDETAEKTGTAAPWYVTATSGATPGQPNKP